MTEAEWLTGTDPANMLEHLRDRVSERKLRLFACGCCAKMWETAPPELVERVIRIGEKMADRSDWNRDVAHVLWDEIFAAHLREAEVGNRITAARLMFSLSCLGLDPLDLLTSRIRYTSLEKLLHLPQRLFGWFRGETPMFADNRLAAVRRSLIPVDSVRSFFGNPFRPVTFSPDWRTDTAVTLAQQMYETRDFSVMPILADALQDAGCDSAAILGHSRSPGPHVRGCWVVDLCLGLE